MKRLAGFALVAVVLLGVPAWTQDKPAQEKKLNFNFKESSIDAVLQYVCREMGWTLVYGTKPEGTITAWNDSPISQEKLVDFLNQCLAKCKVQCFQFGGVLKVVTDDEAKKGTFNIDYGDDPTKIPVNDTIRTWIIPCKNANVIDIQKELKDVLVSDGMTFAVNTYSNCIVVTGKSSSIYRIARIMKIIDVQATDKLSVKMFKLRHADAQETAKVLNEIFKKEAVSPTGRGNPWQDMARAFGMGGQGGQQGPTAKTLASETMRITSDVRTNAVIITATAENVKMIEDILTDLDKESVEAIRLKLYPLRYADAKDVATVITSIFADEATQSRQASRAQAGRGQPFWMPGQPQQPTDTTGASREVRAVSDTRTNSIVIAANETNLKLIDQLVAEMDRQLTDVLKIKIYELKNGDATAMSNILKDIFRPQVTATQNAGRPQQGGQQQNQLGMGGATTARSGGSGLAPSQEVEITADTRTNSVLVKASETYIEIADQIVAQLDQNPTESMQTTVLDLKNGDAATVAQVLQSLLRGGNSNTNRNTTNSSTNRNNSQTPSTRSAPSGGTRNLGPMQDDPTQIPPPPQDDQDEQDRRGITGQVDVQADAATNSLVIRTSPRNLEAIKNIVKNLDRMRPQVLIKVLIAEVTLDQQTQFGVEGFWENKFHVKGDSITQRHGTDFNLPSQGLASLISGDEIQVKLNAFAQDGKLKVLATPRVLVLDNETANINVGKQVPRVTNTTINTLGNTVNTIQYENLGILLTVTPHINFDGLVTMVVHPEISDIAPASEAVVITPGVTSPTFFINSADTTVASRNGQTVIIGGLIRDSETDTVQRIPILGDIPILGFLFSSTSKQKVKRELMIFLTPYVAFTSTELEELTELEKSKLKLIQDSDIEAEGDKWLKKVKK